MEDLTVKKYFTVILLVACVMGGVSYSSAKPVRLIFDTDMGNDVDDALVLAMIHALESRGECKLLAITLTKDNEYSAPFVDLLNTFYGRGRIPIGVVRGGATPEDGKYVRQVATASENGKNLYLHDLVSGKNAPEATELLRKILASEQDGSVVIAQVGFSTNLARLLDTEGDKYSGLSGRELVSKKVKLLSIMAGAFKPIESNERYLEYNITCDIPSAKKLFADWPGPMVISGFEIGIAVPYPVESIQNDFEYVEHHPVKDAYELYCGLEHNRPTWDLTSVLYAVRPERKYFDLSQVGRVAVEDDGFTRFEPDIKGTRRYLILNEAQKVRTTEALTLLSSQPADK